MQRFLVIFIQVTCHSLIQCRTFCLPVCCLETEKLEHTKLYFACETGTLTLREEHRLRVFENRVLRRIFLQKKDEMIGVWRKLHSEELYNLYH
jgi:hypothetical protein